MTDYRLSTNKSWAATFNDLGDTFRKWGIIRWSVEPMRQPRASESQTVTLRYWRNAGEIVLTMGKQWKAADNLRVLYLAVDAMRLNEVRGISEVVASAYAQLTGPVKMDDPYAVLGVESSYPLDVIESIWKAKLRAHHPDRGGSSEAATKLNAAMDAIRKARVQP